MRRVDRRPRADAKADGKPRPDRSDRSDRSDPRDRDRSAERPDRLAAMKEKVRAIDKLARPSSQAPSARERRRDPTLRYMLYEDAQECTFKVNDLYTHT